MAAAIFNRTFVLQVRGCITILTLVVMAPLGAERIYFYFIFLGLGGESGSDSHGETILPMCGNVIVVVS